MDDMLLCLKNLSTNNGILGTIGVIMMGYFPFMYSSDNNWRTVEIDTNPWCFGPLGGNWSKFFNRMAFMYGCLAFMLTFILCE